MLQRYVRLLAWAAATGWIVGLVVFGLGGRIAMRILALTSDDGVQGAFTDAGEEIGQVSLEGTVVLFLFAGLGGGLIAGLAYALVRPILPGTRAPRLLACAVLGAVVGTVLLVNPDGVDFAILEPLWLAVGLFTLLGALGGVGVSVVGDRLRPWYDTVPVRGWAVLAFVPLVVFVFPFFAVLAVAGGIVWAIGQRTASLTWARPLARGLAAVGVAVLALVAVGKIAEVDGRAPRTSDFVEPDF